MLKAHSNFQVPDDELRWVRHCADDDLVVLASQNGLVLVNSCNKVSCVLVAIAFLFYSVRYFMQSCGVNFFILN
jgi:hypothetical protein